MNNESNGTVSNYDDLLKERLTMVRDWKLLNGETLGYSPLGLKYFGSEALVLQEGRRFYPRPLPAETKKMKGRECYKNALLYASKNNLLYCEGFAYARETGAALEIPHAWVVDKNGYVIDPTWGEGLAYFGIAFSLDYVLKITLRDEHYGMIPDVPLGRHNPFLNGYPSGAIFTAFEE